MTTLKTHTTSKGNKLKFQTTFLIEVPHVIVVDESCQLERTYIVGKEKELTNYEVIEITSVDQVINAWVNEELHF